MGETIEEEEKTPNPKVVAQRSINMMEKDEKLLKPIEKSNQVDALKLRRRIESEQFNGNNLQYPLLRYSGTGDNQSLSQAPPEHRENLLRKISSNVQSFKKNFKEDQDQHNLSCGLTKDHQKSALQQQNLLPPPQFKLRVSKISLSNKNSPENKRKIRIKQAESSLDRLLVFNQ